MIRIGKKRWLKFGLFLLSIAFSFAVLSTAIVNKKYDLRAGEISPVDFKATQDVVDKVTTSALIEDARSSVQRQYKQEPDVRRSILRSNNEFFNDIINSKNPMATVEDIAEVLVNRGTYGIGLDGYRGLLRVDNNELRIILTTLNNEVNKIYDTPLQEDDPSKLERSREDLREVIGGFNINDEAKSAINAMLIPQIRPNYFFDEEATQILRDEAEDGVTPIVIKKNQTIVKEGDPISVSQLAVLEELGFLSEGRFNFMPLTGLGIVVLLAHLLIYFYLRRFYRDIVDNMNKLTVIFLIQNLWLLMARALVIISPFLVPLTFLPMLLTILIKNRIGQTLAIFSSILMAVIVGFNPQMILVLMVTSVMSVIFMKRVEERNDIVKSSFYVGVIAMVMTIAVGMMISNEWMANFRQGLYVAVGAVVSGILVIGVLPIIENLFNIVTDIKLLELANPNNPLLKRLQMEAPGTYHHSIMVGNLSEAAGEELNANTILLRVSAYFHDIGKLSRPQFFRENQVGNKNPHDEISPNLSTLIIINHVKVGLEMADKAKLPGEIKDMIAQHHGTTLVNYFFLTLKNGAEDPDSVKEEDFRYPGPKPRTKEAGILLLADSVEAAVRSIQEPTSGKVEAMVYKIFKDKLEDGQLDDCDLTFKEVGIIRKSFLKTLGSIYHERIEYPEDKRKNRQGGGSA